MVQPIQAAFLLVAACGIVQISGQVKPTPNCVVRSADVGFLVDASGSVDTNEWNQGLTFAKNIANGYDIGTNKVRVGLVEFSSQATVQFDFNKFNKKADVLNAITNAKKSNGGTDTSNGLNLVKNTLFQAKSGMRPKVPHILMVITDGQSNSATATENSAKQLHAAGVTVFAIGVKGANVAELNKIASAPNLVFSYNDYSKLSTVQAAFNKIACEVAVKLAPTTPFRPPAPTKQTCVAIADIAFIVDASGSVGSTEWTQALNFAKNVVGQYDIGPSKTRVALMEFSGAPSIQFDFNKYTNKVDVLNAIPKAKKSGGGTATSLALDLARTTLLQPGRGMRPGVPNILFVITDGRSNSETATKQSAALLHNKGVTVFAVGVKGANLAELKTIASDPTLSFSYQDFSKLATVQDTFNKKACHVAVQLAQATTPSSGCSTNSADMVFVVDTSSSVGDANFNLTKSFLRSMMAKLDFSKNRVAIIQFNDKVKTVFELNQHNNKGTAQSEVDKMQYDKGPNTRISAAIKHMREQSFSVANGDRPTVADIGILLTDGQSKDPFRTQYEANVSKAAGIEMFSIGIGTQINSQELQDLASGPRNVFLVNSYQTLQSIEIFLANKLCQGFTPPPVTAAAPCLCKDKDSDCAGYGTNICFEGKYRLFAEDKCAAYCDLCKPGCRRVLPAPKACKDTISDCKNRIDVCNPKYKKYALTACPRFCNFCSELNPTPIIQTTTPSTPAPPTTKKIQRPTKKVVTHPPTPFKPCDTSCYDLKRDCHDYNKADCQRTDFQQFFKTNCAEYCGFCTPKASCMTTPGACVDTIDCTGYTDSTCRQYPDWAKANCRRRCGLCPGGPTLPPANVCRDKDNDCAGYGKDMCTDYPVFAKDSCALHCGFCVASGPTTKRVCENKRDCTVYKLEFCRNPDYRKFMLAECRLYCNACDAEN
ncbi:collagen alpha-6(VI) chain-like [Watersipora subatra]|uniref:collagen alpha-6(VI) chain-like n=1 Tax=Watersipora subatra TaxID=2589382 RepID=UPI00355B7C3E